MGKRITLATAVAIALSVMLLAAQETVTLGFDLFRNGRLVAGHTVTLAVGTTASLRGLSGLNVGQIAFTPTKRTQDRVWVALDIDSGGRQLKPLLGVSTEPGTIRWTAVDGSDSFELLITLIR